MGTLSIYTKHGYVGKRYNGKGHEYWMASLFCERSEFDSAPGKEKPVAMAPDKTWYVKQLTKTIELVCTEPPVTK